MALRFAALLLPALVNARLGSGIVELTPDTFDKFVQDNPKAMIDFMDSSSEEYQEETVQLTAAIRQLTLLRSRVPVARVDFSKYPELVKSFMQVGCSDSDMGGAQICGNKLPQLMWFRNGKASQYHRYLRSANFIATFVLIMDREPLTTIKEEPKKFGFSQVVLAKMPEGSPELKVLEEVAEKYMDSVSFLHMPSEEKSITWVANSTMTDYFTDAVDANGIAHWVQIHVAQSDDVPEKPIDDGSVVVVGKTFDELVLRDDMDVMMLAYAPWCGFSRKTMPAWAEFARRAVGSKLVVAKMDASRNRSPTPGFSWTTFPSIIFVRKGERSVINFNGTNRTVEALMEFAHQHSSESEPLAFDDAAIMLQSNVQENEL
jgi:thiol-disulfide isomerase/thioredoxin